MAKSVNEAETNNDSPSPDSPEKELPASDSTEAQSGDAPALDTPEVDASASETAADAPQPDAPVPPPKAPPKAPKKAEVKAETQEPRDMIRAINLDGSPDMGEAPRMDWFILKVAFNREDTIADALRKKVKMEGMEDSFGEVVVPTEDVATFTRDGKRRISKRKLLPGYIMVNMLISDETWFMVRETGGISDFTGAAGKPMPMEPSDIERFINRPVLDEEEEAPIKIGIPFKVGDRVRVKEGNFENQEGDVDTVDEANGRITVIINIFGRSVPMELDHWQVEPL